MGTNKKKDLVVKRILLEFTEGCTLVEAQTIVERSQQVVNSNVLGGGWALLNSPLEVNQQYSKEDLHYTYGPRHPETDAALKEIENTTKVKTLKLIKPY